MSIAEQSLKKAIKRRAVRMVILKNDKAFDALYKQLQTAMTNAWDEAMREGIASSLDRLRDLGVGKFTKEDGKMILRQLENAVGTDAIQAAMHKPVLSLSDALYRLGAEEVGKAAGVSIGFNRPDLDALDILKTGNLYWVGNSWNTHTQKLFDNALKDYFTEGMTREGLTERFATDFAGLTTRGQRYWEMLADHTATKTREMGRVTGYERAAIQKVQVRAHLDARTTKICRDMNGRIIAVKNLRAQRDTYLDAISKRNEVAAKRAWKMHGASADLGNRPTNKLGKDTASPPYHFRCRTITVMWTGLGDKDIDRWTLAAYDREPLGRKDVGKIIEQSKSAQWPHTKVARGHYRKHGKRLGITNQSDYNQSAVDLIRRADRDVYISMRKGALNATFVKAQRVKQSNGKVEPGYLLTSVDLAENKITSHYWRKNLGTSGDDVPAQKQDGRGILKWII